MSVGARKSKRMLPIVAIFVFFVLAIEFIIITAVDPDFFNTMFEAGNTTMEAN